MMATTCGRGGSLRNRLRRSSHLFSASLATLAALMAQQGVPKAAETVEVRNTEELAAAINLANTGVDVMVRNPNFGNIQITGPLPPLTAGSLQFGVGDFSFSSLPTGGSLTADAPLILRSANSDARFLTSTNISGSGPVSVVGTRNTTRITFSGTNSYTGGTTIIGTAPMAGFTTPRTTLLFDNTASLPPTGDIALRQGGIVGVRFPINQAFLDRITPDSAGVVAFAQGVSQSANLSFANLPNVSLGALGTPGFNAAGEPRIIVNSFYSGTLTPHGTTYRLGGGDGTLIVQSALNNVSPTPGGLVAPTRLEVLNNGNTQLTATNGYTGGTHIISGALQLGHAGALGGGSARDVQIDAGATLLTNFQLTQAILNRILPTSEGTVAFSVNTSNALDFNAAGLTNVSLGGSQGFVDQGSPVATFSGALTPAANTYRLGGPFGPLYMATRLTGANDLEIRSGSVSLINANNDFTGETRVLGGTLSLGNGAQNGNLLATSGIVLGPSGSFNFNQATASTFDRVISGQGSMSQSGLGPVTLTQPQQYTGSTSLSSTLILGPGSSIANSSSVFLSSVSGRRGILDLTIAGDQTIRRLSSFSSDTLVRLGPGTLTLENTGLFGLSSFGGVIEGPGRLATTGDAGFRLEGNNTYSGGTVIGGAELQLGGTTNGTLGTGDVVINSSLVLRQPNAMTLANQLSGPGSLVQRGPGAVTLTADNTYTGGTTIEAGTLRLGAGGTSGSIVGNVENSGNLVFNRSDAITFAGVISGTGAVTQAGSGQTTLTGASTYSGPTSVNAGTLLVQGSIGSSPVTVDDGATLGGNGTVGTTTIASGGTLSPGASIGTVTVNGNLTFAPGSTYRVEVSPTEADRTIVTGTANLAGTVQALFGPGSYNARSYTILSAGARNGTFEALTTTGLPAFLRAELQYNATDALLVTLTSQIAPPTPPTPPTPTPTPTAQGPVFAVTPNQRAVGGALDAIFNAGGGLFPGLATLAPGQMPQALDALSGEIHASDVTAAVEASRLVRDAIMGRLWQGLDGLTTTPVLAMHTADLGGPPAPRPVALPSLDPRVFALWGQAFGSWGSTHGDGNAARLGRDGAGFVIGADATLWGTTRFGLAGGFQRTTLDLPGRLSSGTTDRVFAAVYGGTSLGPVNLRLGASYAGQETDTLRTVMFPGFADRVRASVKGHTAQAFGELGTRLSLFPRSVLEPFVGVTALTVHRDRFAEGGGAAALVGLSRDHDLAYGTVGIRSEWRPFDAPIVIRGMTGFRRTFGDVRPDALLAFRSAAATPFEILGAPLDRNVLVTETAIDWRVSDAITLTAAYSSQLSSRASEHGFKGQLLVRF